MCQPKKARLSKNVNSECCVEVLLDRTSHFLDAKEPEEILPAEEESDPVETLTTMVMGCENFVTIAIMRIHGHVPQQCKKIVSDLDDKLAKRDSQIEEINRQIADLESRLGAREEEIDRLKCNTACKCKELFDSFITCAHEQGEWLSYKTLTCLNHWLS